MEYSQAKNIRRTGLGTLIRNRMLDNNQSIAKSVVGSISDKFKAKLTGIQEKLDPLNLAKKLTGGSNLAPALLGKMTGRKLSTIRYFIGGNDKKTYKSLGPIPTTSGDTSSVSQLYKFMVKAHEQDKKRYAIEGSFREEQRNEDQKNHEQFLEVLKMYTRLPITGAGTTVVQQNAEVDSEGLISTITKKFGEISDFLKGILGAITSFELLKKSFELFKEGLKWITDLKWLTKLGGFGTSIASLLLRLLKFSTTPLGVALLGATTVAAFLAILKKTKEDIESNPYDPEYRFNPYAMVLRKEAKSVAEAGAQLTRMTTKSISRPEIEKAVADNIPDDVSQAAYGTTTDNLKKWLQENPKEMTFQAAVAPIANKPNTAVQAGGNPAPVAPTPLASDIAPSTAGAGRGTELDMRRLDLSGPSIPKAQPIPGRNMEVGKMVQDSALQQLAVDTGTNTVTGQPIMFNNTNTSKLPDRKPSSSPNVRDMSPRVGDAFSYLKKAQRSY